MKLFDNHILRQEDNWVFKDPSCKRWLGLDSNSVESYQSGGGIILCKQGDREGIIFYYYEDADTVSFVFAVKPSCRGQSFSVEMIKEFRARFRQNIIAVCHRENEASIRIINKLTFFSVDEAEGDDSYILYRRISFFTQ